MTSLIIHDIYPLPHNPLLPHPPRPPLTGRPAVAATATILVKIAFFGILANFDVIFRGEGVEISKFCPHTMLKGNSRPVQI